MPAAKRLLDPKLFFYDFTPEIVRRMNARSFDGPETAEVWQRYLSDRNRADFDWLFNQYLPVVWYEARKVKRQQPGLFPDPLGDYVSDACLGLLQTIPQIKFFTPGVTQIYIRQYVKRAIWNLARSRSWAGRKRIESMRTIQQIRSVLTAQHGCVPEREAIVAALAEKVKNPNIYFSYFDEGINQMVPRSQLEKEDGRKLMRNEDPHSPDPSAKVMDEEVVRLAMKGLDKVDRKILRMALAGDGDTAIGKAVGLSRSRVRVRLNGVLWESRCRADLAAYLGVEPDEAPVKAAHRGGLIAIAKMPPARLAS
jgi:RNA polymerase sigma factor (sigma-70 family)